MTSGAGAYFDVEVEDGIATLWIDTRDGTVNTLSLATMETLTDALDRVEADDVVGAVVASRKHDFLAGADIAMFRTFEDAEQVRELVRGGQRLLHRLARLEKPVVAAVHGACVGGGLELALACDYRIASDDPRTRFAAAEVKLGLLPAFGGCQRLPRTIGVQAALEMLLTGKNAYAAQASGSGLVDATIHRAGLVSAARRAAREMAEGGQVPESGGRAWWREAVERTPLRRVVYERAKAGIDERTHGNYPAPYRILDAVRTGLDDGFEAGLAAEAEHFAELVLGPEAQALIHLFFARKSSEKNPLGDRARPVTRVGVVGAGLMGAGIAQVSAASGRDVILKDRDIGLAAEGKGRVFRGVSKRVGKGIGTFERDRIVERVVLVDDWAPFRRAELVVEAVVEDLDVKRAVLRDLEAAGGGERVLASNTSSLSIGVLAEAVERPERVVGMHYFSPVPDMPLLEVVASEWSAEWAVATAVDVGLEQGKAVIRAADRPGFWVNRLLAPYLDEALRLLEEGASIEDVDGAVAGLGFPYGPLRLLDEVGLDVAAHVDAAMRGFMRTRGRELTQAAARLLDTGWAGKKSGRGFYVWQDGERAGPNADVYPLFGDAARRTIPKSDIRERCLLAIVNEAAAAYDEGVVDSPVAGDVGAVFGFGFPPYLGGPFFYLDREGPAAVADRLDRLADDHGDRFRPAPALRERAASGRTYHETYHTRRE